MALSSIFKSEQIITCQKDTDVGEIARLMKEHSVGCILVTEDNAPVGIVTDRDIVLRHVASNAEAQGSKASDIMSTPVETISEEAGVYDLVTHMNEHKIKRICITDSKGKCLNVISSGDILELLARELAKVVGASSSPTRMSSDEVRAAS